MSADSVAIYSCSVCTNPRRFGNGFPDDRSAVLQLNCGFCQRTQPHRFDHVDFEGIPQKRFRRVQPIAKGEAHA